MKQNLIISLIRALGGYPSRAIITFLCVIYYGQIAAYDVELDGIGYSIYGDKAYVYGYWGNNDDVIIPRHLSFDYKQFYPITFLPDPDKYEIIHVEAEVVGIYSEAFRGCSSLKSINIPESVETIDAGAFRDCSSLKSISLPDSLKTISDSVFYNCTSLESVALPESLETIGKKAFYNCPSLTAMKISQTLKTIGDDAFAACTGLKNVEIYNTDALTIGYGAFKDCYSIEKVLCREIKKWCLITFSDSLANPIYYSHHLRYPPTTLYPKGKPVSKINVPKGIKEISPFAFIHADDMTYIDLPTSIEAIGDYAFSSAGANIQKVRVRFRDAFEIPDNTFNERTYRNTPLLVYIGNEEGFRNTKAWRNFKNISPTGDYVFTFEKIVNWDATLIELLESLGMENWDTNYDGVLSYGDDPLTLPETTDEDMLLTWTSSNTDVAVINDYTLAIVGPGTTTIVVSILDGDTNVLAAKEFTLTVAKCPSYIQFADATVKAICVANWDTDGDGELSEEEAAKVKDIGTVFQSNKEITSFDELQYFTGLTSIGYAAFYKCSGLTSVNIPNSVTSIGDYTFMYCAHLTSVTIPNSVTSIGQCAFFNCLGLTSITIPTYVTNIGNGAFFTGKGLTSINVAADNPKYDSRQNCNAIIETSTNTLILGCNNTIIPNDVVSIIDAAFSACTGLASITIPKSVTSIGKEAFDSCSGLTSIKVASGNPKYDSRQNCNAIIETSTNTLILGCQNTIIPNGVARIEERAFHFCTGLTSVTIPNSVTSIGDEAFSGCSNLKSIICQAENVPATGNSCFYNVPSSTATLYVPASAVNAYKSTSPWSDFGTIQPISDDTNPNIQFADDAVKAICIANWDTNGDGELSKDEAAQVTNIGTIFKSNETITSFDELQYFTGLTSLGYSAFEGCSNLTSVTFGNGLKSIGSWAFYLCSSLTSVTIPNNVTSINEGAFSYCTSLKSATIGDGVTGIGHSAFSYCTDLVSVTIGNSVRSIGNSAFVGCSSLPSIDIPNSVTSIAAGTFWGCTSLKSVTVPSSVESIGSDAFSGCYGLASVTLNSNNIVSAAYSSSNNLKTIFGSQVTRYILGNDVTSIGANAFRGCSDLISVTVPNSVTSIGEGAFAECDGLTSVTLNSNNIVSSTYTSSSNLNTVFGSQVIEYIIGDEVTSIGNYAFYSSTGLTSLTIGNGVTNIGDRAFYGCTGLKNVVCRAQRVPTASSNCFGGITLSSATLYVPASSVNSYKSTSPWSDFGTVTSIPDNFQIWGIKVNKSEILLHAQGNPYQLTATVVPEYAANKALTWTSSNTSVATVDANGLITPVNQGTAVITATTKDGTNLSATCTVTVDADNIIKDVSQLSNDKCYYIYTKDQLRGGLGVNKKYGSLASTFSVTNVKYKTENMSPFVFFKYHDKFLLYSVEANAFVTYNGGLTRMNIIGSNAINVTKNTNEYFMFSFASTGGVVNINTNPGLAINNWGTTSSQFDEGNQFIIEIAGDFDPSVMVALINESETVSDEDEEHYAQTPIQSVSELVNGQVYTAVTNRAAWYVPESGTQLESSKLPIWDKWSCKNAGQQFAFILHDGKYYIYNVGEQKILNGITDNSPNHGELVTDNCQPVTISGTGNLQYPLFFSYGASYNVNINSWGEVVIDTWATLDDGNMVALRPVQGVTLSESDLRRIIRYIDGSIPGDVNGDGDVNGADIVAVINYVLNDSKTEGDVNGDGEVNGADIVAVINYVLSYTSDAVRQQTYYAHRAPARPTDTSDRLYANTVADGITVGLTNETDFTAFQFMLQLPEDCTLENVIADGLRLDNHVLQFRRMADGRYFVLGYNLDNENIAGHDGALLRLQLAGNICEGASVTDVMFFTPEAETRHLAGIQIDLVTGLTSLENATEDVTGNIYDMQGRIVMTSGQYAKQKNFLPTGIYIRNGRKFIVK